MTLMGATASTSLGNVIMPSGLEANPHLPEPRAPRGRGVRIAHITDAHVEPEGPSAAGLKRCLKHIHKLKNAPEFVLNGGDAIMDAFKRDSRNAAAQWELWNDLLDKHVSLPVKHCLGNHDVPRPNCDLGPGFRPKKVAMDRLGLKYRYYGVDLESWELIVLDSVFLTDDSYVAKLDDDQFAWLQKALAAVKPGKPIIVLSHIPILSACVFFDGDNETVSNWSVPGGWMHLDARRIKDLFKKHSNVRLCLSGHIHLQDRVDYNGVTYLCNGSVCGNWWKGPYHECPPGYAIIDLYDDGTFDHQYVTY
jgi:3',5'-cyclic AMP phosphodiesterase CpdA